MLHVYNKLESAEGVSALKSVYIPYPVSFGLKECSSVRPHGPAAISI